MKKKEKSKSIEERDKFIDFMASLKPGDINKLIEEKGKPVKHISPIFFYDDFKE
jgi:hypothetical protein